MAKTIRIGTRDSELALWQAHTVQDQLQALGYKTKLVSVKSTGDLILDKPLYELGITGIFTKTLDVAMINGTVDIAVHSMKDVPTQLPKGIVQGAVLPRAAQEDIFVFKDDKSTAAFDKPVTIATGSLRRKAQWLNKYPHHNVVDLRGNVNTRLQKVADNEWAGAIFAKAGLERINLKPENHDILDWMIPAPAQGAMVIAVMENDAFCKEACNQLNDVNAELATRIEREFLRKLEGGCTAPIGAYAKIKEGHIHFHGALFSLDGTQKLEIEETIPASESENFGALCALKILDDGGRELMEAIKKEL
ncbi:hydroxymethylbilane synthase [Leeuwenhoekiella aestuarii]|uniref:Hydroxymethylbilane synthase n=1 Tax=Leeuwenhoekiella aestuarii TaxID=2249426 RepID=A0A4Q0NZW4_9FLAO|nr:hydroxymethylbilane synthase [Leeuwenhoekiella aestuarii]RXG17856.1 hydroxymethylbilane synthase [Leeuwenhoekiella aestuarii]RXG19185.1 hydroxymethylbilane synthase [Leeuwenhoekiella aestuarii]